MKNDKEKTGVSFIEKVSGGSIDDEIATLRRVMMMEANRPLFEPVREPHMMSPFRSGVKPFRLS